MNPYDRTVWDYNVDIAREALDMGFAEVQWDYVRFPDVTEARRRTMAFPGSNGVSREDNIAAFIRYSRERLAEYRVPVTADVFGLITQPGGGRGDRAELGEGDPGGGRGAAHGVPVALLPRLLRLPGPNAHPYEMIRICMQDGVERAAFLRKAGEEEWRR